MGKVIAINNPGSDNMGASLHSLLLALEQFNTINFGNELIIDLSKLSFIHPFLILPVCSLISEAKQNGVKISFLYNNVTESYLDTILFPNGFNALSINNWNDYLLKFQTKTYLPICMIPVEGSNTLIREQLLTVFENILLHQLQITGQMISVVKYLIGEAMDNIVDHADVTNGWIMVQNYPTKGFLDICILDSGIGLLGTYKKFGFDNISSDTEALEQAINGKSTKQITETRGYGIDTSRRMLVDGLKGKYLLFSGAVFYVYTKDLEQITPLNRNNKWNGTILALRIPKLVPQSFTYFFLFRVRGCYLINYYIILTQMENVINIQNYLPATITSRKSIELFKTKMFLKKQYSYVFDFKNIDFISRAFADELFHFINDNKMKIEFINANPNILEMFNVVQKNKKKQNSFHKIAIIPFQEEEKLSNFLSLI